MRTRPSLSSLSIPGTSRVRVPGRACAGGTPGPRAKELILLISEDTAVAESFRRAAEVAGRSMVRAAGWDETLRTVQMVQPVAVVLDLDLPSDAAWEIADRLLQGTDCAPLVLLTGRRDQFEVSAAIRAGALVDKSAGLAKVLEAVDLALALADDKRRERKAVQRITIQWLRPCGWSAPVTATYRHWGINE